MQTGQKREILRHKREILRHKRGNTKRYTFLRRGLLNLHSRQKFPSFVVKCYYDCRGTTVERLICEFAHAKKQVLQ